MITLDGAAGEGGGQILRTALALSACTGQPFSIHSIRAHRRRAGLLHQHLTAVRAAAAVCRAEVQGAELGSRAIEFSPGEVVGGRYRFAIPTAGSTTLVLQAVLPPLVLASGGSRVEISGGTHNKSAPPFEFLVGSFLPLLERCGPRVQTRLRRPGFHPAGGGQIEVDIEPSERLQPFELRERGPLLARRAVAIVANLPASIAEQELKIVQRELKFSSREVAVEVAKEARGPGNALVVEHRFEHVTEVSTGFGERGVPAKHVARGVVKDARRYLDSGAPVSEHLADQLVIPLALAGGGSFRTETVSSHTATNISVVETFLPVKIEVAQDPDGSWSVAVR